MQLTRRHALAGAAALAATPLLPSMPVRAAAPVADKQAPSFYRYKVGDIQVTVVSDGKTTFPLEDSFVSNAKKAEVNAALALPEVAERLVPAGAGEPYITTLEEFAALIRRDYEKYGNLIRKLGVKAD